MVDGRAAGRDYKPPSLPRLIKNYKKSRTDLGAGRIGRHSDQDHYNDIQRGPKYGW